MKINLFLIALVLLVCETAKAGTNQEKVPLIGKVVDINNQPVPGVIVFIDTIKTDVVTNTRGYFQINVTNDVKRICIYSEEHGILAADYSGEKTLVFKYLNNDVSTQVESDLIEMGYGKYLNKDVKSPISNVEYKENDSNGFTNIYDMIKGRVPGVTVTADKKIIIRGIKTLMASSDPLFVVDGTVRNSIDDILPHLVKSISVLKGSDATMYGSRGANGVIEITLK